MKSVFKFLPLALLLASCGGGKTYTIEVHNQSAKRFDSVHVFIDTSPGEEPAVKYEPLGPGQSMPPLTVGEIFGTQHQKMTGTAIFYAADTVIRRPGSYTGGMVVFKHYKITIDSSLQIKWEEWD
jgi:hypothetical protein